MIFGIALDRKNPEYTKADMLLWMPKLRPFLETEDGDAIFNMLLEVANEQIFHSIWGSKWKYAMALCIAHYLILIAKNGVNGNVGDDLSSVATLDTYPGMLSSMTVGSFSKSYDLTKTMIDTDDAKWWNLTSPGAQLMAMFKTTAAPSIFVVTPTPGPSFERDVAAFMKKKNADVNVIISEMNAYLRQQENDIDELKQTRAISGKND